jgi:hypothetical protein
VLGVAGPIPGVDHAKASLGDQGEGVGVVVDGSRLWRGRDGGLWATLDAVPRKLKETYNAAVEVWVGDEKRIDGVATCNCVRRGSELRRLSERAVTRVTEVSPWCWWVAGDRPRPGDEEHLSVLIEAKCRRGRVVW